MGRLLVFASVFAVGLVLGLMIGRGRPQPEPLVVQSSFAVGDAATERFLQARVKAIRWRAGTTDSVYGIEGPSTPNQTWIIAGRTRLSIPDHHGSTDLAVINVEAGKATIAVLQRFNHMSYGKNLITVDCRIVEVDVTAASP